MESNSEMTNINQNINNETKKKKKIPLFVKFIIIFGSVVLVFIFFHFVIWPMVQVKFVDNICKKEYDNNFKAVRDECGYIYCVNDKGEKYSPDGGSIRSCNPHDYHGNSDAKPIIYIYPEYDMDLEIKLGNPDMGVNVR